jgi:ADP-heptose:LPS heptosyltransferase
MSDAQVIDLKTIKGIESIILVRLFALGDIVLTLPLIRQVRESFPGAWIGYLVKERFAEALAGETGLDEVIPLPDSTAGQLAALGRIRKRKPDVAIDLLSSPRSALLTRFCGAGLRVGMDTGRRNGYYDEVLPRAIMRDGKRVRCYTIESNRELCRFLGLPAENPGYGTDAGDKPYGFPAAARASEWARSFVGSLGETEKGLAGIVPGSTYPSKGWPTDRFIDLSRRISSELGMRPVIMWGPGEEKLAMEIAGAVPGAIVPPVTGVAEAGALIGRMKILVGIDSGPKHVAVLLGVPTVTLFGPTDPRIWDPVNSLHRVLWKGLDCAEGCRDKECTPNRCMDMITVDEVFSEVRDVIGGEV